MTRIRCNKTHQERSYSLGMMSLGFMKTTTLAKREQNDVLAS